MNPAVNADALVPLLCAKAIDIFGDTIQNFIPATRQHVTQ